MQPVQFDDLLSYRFLSQVRFSPNGEWVAFVVKRAKESADGYASDIHIARTSDGHVRRLTSSGTDGPYLWEADGQSIAFLSKRETHENASPLFRIPIDGGEAERIAVLPHTIGQLIQVEKDSVLYTARVPVGDHDTSEDADDYEVLEEIPFWGNAQGFTSRRRVHLFQYNMASDESQPLFADPALSIHAAACRGAQISVLARRFEGMGAATHELWTIAPGEPKCLSRNTHLLDAIDYLDDSTVVVLGTDAARYGRGQNREVLLIDVTTGKLRSITPDWDRSLGSSVIGDTRHGGGPSLRVESGRIHLTITERTASFVETLDRDGNRLGATVAHGSVDAFDVCQGRCATVELRADRLQELYLHSDEDIQPITDLNTEALANRSVQRPEAFTVVSPEGHELDAWIVRPDGIEPGAKVPAVLTIHGGPRAAYGDVFFHEVQALAGAGYAMIFTNPRGSSGRGNEFADLRGKYGTIDYDDLTAVLDAVIERYDFIDPERLGVMGGSYGGYMTNWMIGMTDRFKAAVSQRSIASWTHKFCTTDIGYQFSKDQVGVDPWEDGGHDKLWWHSPLRLADKARTPTLLIHSDQDLRTYQTEGMQMFTALRYHGVESRLVIFHGENHELSRSGMPKHRLRRLHEIVTWLDRFLKEA